jgi:hypothetical protein
MEYAARGGPRGGGDPLPVSRNTTQLVSIRGGMPRGALPIAEG